VSQCHPDPERSEGEGSNFFSYRRDSSVALLLQNDKTGIMTQSVSKDEALKNRIVIILAVLSVVFFFGTLSSCNSAMRQKAARDKEMSARLAIEERMNKFSQERSTLEEKAKVKEKEAQDLKEGLEAAKKALVQDQLVNQSLKEELKKVTKLKETLEENLKEAAAEAKKFKK